MSIQEFVMELIGGENLPMPDGRVSVDAGWYQIALKHYCGICERWFGDTRGKLMHDRHRHKS